MTEFITGWPNHPLKNTWLTIGNFDGVHLGHQALIQSLKERAEEQQGQSLVITFWPHPRVVLGQVSEAFLLTTQQEKERQLQIAQVDLVVTLPFDQHLADMHAEAFLERLYANLRPAGLLVGPEFHLGKIARETSTSFRTFANPGELLVRALHLSHLVARSFPPTVFVPDCWKDRLKRQPTFSDAHSALKVRYSTASRLAENWAFRPPTSLLDLCSCCPVLAFMPRAFSSGIRC